ncbi:MAG TPA: GNAT family N-acetyltransferase, partial [Pirellulaceae bacterium]
MIRELSIDNPEDRRRWDHFLLSSIRGQHVQLTTWLASYRSYGGDYRVLLAESDDTILGGVGLIELGHRLCRIAHCPAGPIVAEGQEHLIPELIRAACDLARRRKCVSVQFQPPTSLDPMPRNFGPPAGLFPGSDTIRPGAALPGLVGVEQMLWVDFPPARDVEEWTATMFEGFSASTRRNLRLADRSGVEVREARDADELREGYAVIEQNGAAQGYPTRTWAEFGETLSLQVAERHASLFTARHEGRLLGAVYGCWAGRRFSDSMAGTIRSKPDLKIGHFLRWGAMRAAWERGMLGYDLTADGPPGVRDAKYGFGPTKIEF